MCSPSLAYPIHQHLWKWGSGGCPITGWHGAALQWGKWRFDSGRVYHHCSLQLPIVAHLFLSRKQQKEWLLLPLLEVRRLTNCTCTTPADERMMDTLRVLARQDNTCKGDATTKQKFSISHWLCRHCHCSVAVTTPKRRFANLAHIHNPIRSNQN